MQAKRAHFVAVRGGPNRGFVPNFFSHFWLGTDRHYCPTGDCGTGQCLACSTCNLNQYETRGCRMNTPNVTVVETDVRTDVSGETFSVNEAQVGVATVDRTWNRECKACHTPSSDTSDGRR